MNKTPIEPNLAVIPAAFHPLLQNAAVYDSSCSEAAQVYFIDLDCGYYLKRAEKGTLGTEAELTRWWNSKGLAVPVCDYRSEDFDWLLTEAARGEDCISPRYLAEPQRLCDTLATLLRGLHEVSPEGCPAPNRMDSYFAAAEDFHARGGFHPSRFLNGWHWDSAEEAFRTVQEAKTALTADCPIHGDYCLPNVMLRNWAFSAFIDLGQGGVGNRHIDLYWGLWSLRFNLNTEDYSERFLDVYGRDKVDLELLRMVCAAEAFD